MQLFYKIVILLALECVIIWGYVHQLAPDPSLSMLVPLLVSSVFFIHLILAVVFFFLKRRNDSKIFLFTAVIASIFTYFVFTKGIDKYQNERLEQWTFQKADTVFRITRWKKTKKFNITYREGENSSSWGLLDGKWEIKNNAYILTSDTLNMKIIKNQFIGFRNPSDTIIITKLER